jgi:hypothetical protein
MRRSHRLVLCTVLATVAAVPATAQDADWKQALALYQEWIQRPTLYKRTAARERLAATQDPRAFELLARSYDKPEEPADQVRYLIASITMGKFRGHVEERALDAWRKRHTRADDAWLWFETEREPARDTFPALREQALGKSDPFLRATALEALATAVEAGNAPDGLAGFCLEVLTALPNKEPERGLLTEGIARIVLAARRQVREPAWKPVAEALIKQFDAPGIGPHTQVVLSRFLARTLDSGNLGFESRLWLAQLERQTVKPSGMAKTVAFARLRAIGFRIVYVIDASDSMCKRVTDREKRELGPVTGKPKPAEPAAPGAVPAESELDWNRIVTRFDVGREYVRKSLQNLGPDHSFAVILFGDHAELLAATPRLMPATRETVAKTMAELDAIKQGPPTAMRPDGVIRGRTNLHDGFLRAFQVTRAGETKHAEYVDAKAMTDGCDIVFLLSDGAPSWDDYSGDDKRDPEDHAGDQESGIQLAPQPRLTFYGPYGYPDGKYLVHEVERMNLFRKAEINCVGIGEANHDLLNRLARIGGGQAINIQGEKK